MTSSTTIGASATLSVGAGSATITGGLTNAGTVVVTTGSLTSSGQTTSTNAITLTTGTITLVGNATSSGSIVVTGAGLINIKGNFSMTGALTPSTGTVRFSGAADQLVSNGKDFYNLDITSSGVVSLMTSSTVSGALTTSGTGTLSVASAGGMRVAGTTTIGSGTFYTVNTASSTFVGAVGNSGTMTITTGSVTTTGNLTNSGTMSFTTGSLYAGGNLTNTGTFTPGTLTTVLTGASTQSISGIIFNTVSSTKTAGTVAFGASSTIIGAANMNGGETWTTDVAGGGLTLVANFTVPSGSVFNIGQGSATSTGTFTNHGSFTGGTGMMSFVTATFTNPGGTFDPKTGTVKFLATLPMNVTSTVYYNVVFAGGSVYTIAASTTAIGTTTVQSGNELDIAAGVTYTGRGTFTNANVISKGSGASIVHPPESIAFTNSAGTPVTSFTTPVNVYVTVQDSAKNLLASSAESITVTISSDAAAGGDSETLTLTETGIATGIFRNATALSAEPKNAVWPANSVLDVNANGVGTASYDATSEIDTATVSLVRSSAAAAATDTGGGSYYSGGGNGGGASYYGPLPTYQTSGSQPSQELLNNLTSINVAIHALVKLPNDGNPATQEDSAVYYIGADGKRHAFENAKVYATWYSDFSGVTVISAEKLASIPLGSNVRYKPGTRMVKFTTDPKVYAVSAQGVLRWIKDEATVAAIYGADWNKKIDDLSDTSYTNYSFGPDIAAAGDFNPSTESGAAANISAEF